MHLALLSVSVAFALAGIRAQLPPQVTPCIQNCAVQAVAQDLDGCSVSDVKCLCANKKIQQDMFSCLQQQCTTQELEEVQVVVAAECAPPASSTSTPTSTHSAAPSTAPETHSTSSSEARTSEKTSASSTTTVSTTHLSSTTSVSVASLVNSTSLLSSTSTTPVTSSSSSSTSSSSSDASSTTPSSSAAPASTNAAGRVSQDAIGIYAVFLALLGGAAIW